MSLRQELSLFFGGLLLLVLSLVVWLNYHGLTNTLEAGLKKQFSPQPFLQVAQSERQLLLERARTLVANQLVTSYRVEAIAGLTGPGETSPKLRQARAAGAAPGGLRTALASLYDQTLVVLSGAGAQSSNDLIALTTDDGTLLMETLGVTSEAFAQSPEIALSSEADNLAQAAPRFWELALAEGDLRGYLIYPDGKLYLVGASWFLRGDYFDGLAVVGTAVDREFLSRVAGDSLVFVRYGDQVLGATDQAQTLGEQIGKFDPGAAGERIWRAADGKRYLVKSEPLFAHYSEKGQEGTVSPTQEIGRIAFLRDMAEVEAIAFEQSRVSLLTGLAALVVALMLVPFVARRFTGPIGTLSSAMKEVGEGRLEQIPSEQVSSIREVRDASLSFNQMVIGLRQKKALETFVPEGTRLEVEASGGAAPELGGKRVERTILFSDLRGFTSMSERLTPTQVMEVLNLYLERMTRAIRLVGGDINEYIGDAILAVFETPDSAVKAARAMCEELARLHSEAEVEELKGLGQGIGIHTGPIVEGNIGEQGARLKRAVVGDTVNLAARIQDRSREGKFTCIFLSGDTKARLQEEVPLEFFGDEQFKGKAELIPVWEVRQA